MRLSPLIFLMLASSLAAGEPPPPCPLWDGHESVADYAKRVNLPPTKTLDLGGGVTMELVLIPAGKFIMGTPEPAPIDEERFRKPIVVSWVLLLASIFAFLIMLAVMTIRAIRRKRRPQISLGHLTMMMVVAGCCIMSFLDARHLAQILEAARSEHAAAKMRFDVADQSEKPAHSVTLTKPFYMGKFTVTQEQYQQVSGDSPSYFTGKDIPVENISWDSAQLFCKSVSELSHHAVRLPTEAEWEYACRAGTMTAYYSGDTEADLAHVAWYSANSNGTMHPVGRKEANGFGLYDMYGNAYQWCQDWNGDDYYENLSLKIHKARYRVHSACFAVALLAIVPHSAGLLGAAGAIQAPTLTLVFELG